MSSRDTDGSVVAWLLRASHLLAPEDLPRVVDEGGRRMGGNGCRVYLVTRDQGSLRLLPEPGSPPTDEALSLDGTVPGRAYRMSDVISSISGGARLWVPLLDGTERLGVLELLADSQDDLEALRETALDYAAAVAELVVSKGQYTDGYEHVRRALPMGIAAEMLWRQLPPMTFATKQFVITAQLEPWHEVGGDVFDYSLDSGVLHLAVFDGMGHGLSATLLGSVALAAYRNARRSGQSLVETACRVDAVLADQFGAESFVTGVLGQLDLDTGRLSLLCAAHPAPLLVRDGRPVGEVDVEPGVPLGFGNRADVVGETSLQPGDRLVLFSDGVIEARSKDGEFFGIDRLLDLLTREESAGQPPPETLRRLVASVLEHQQGRLQDDATLLMLEWGADPRVLLPEH